MSVKLVVCLVLLTTIVAEDFIDPEFESIDYKHKHTRKFEDGQRKFLDFFEDSDESVDSPAESNNKLSGRKLIMYIDKAKNNTNSNNTKEVIGQKEKNGTIANHNLVTEKEGLNAESSQTVISYPPYAAYEVTENIIDISDDRPLVGPIVPNFTYFRPLLNTVKPTNDADKDKTTEANSKTKANRVSILHINAEFDDNKVNKVSHNKVTGIFKGIKDYIHNFHRGIVKGIHNFFHKHDDEHDNEERFQRDANKNVNPGDMDGKITDDVTE